MPPLPKRKYPKSRQGKRRSHLRIDMPRLTNCPQCHTPRLPHHACPVCGTYKGREAIKIEEARIRE
ncbi:MAG: 50S ribosomal protein L32 [Dehalococcoidia bacterium]